MRTNVDNYATTFTMSRDSSTIDHVQGLCLSLNAHHIHHHIAASRKLRRPSRILDILYHERQIN